MKNNVPHSRSLGPGSICEGSHFVIAVWVTLAAAAALLGPAGAISPEEEAELTELCDLNPWQKPPQRYEDTNVYADPILEFAMICDMLANGKDICNDGHPGAAAGAGLAMCDDGRLMTL